MYLHTDRWVHYLGATAIGLGVGLCIINVVLATSGQTSDPIWSIIFGATCIPLALSGCLKEWVLTHPTNPQEMNWVSPCAPQRLNAAETRFVPTLAGTTSCLVSTQVWTHAILSNR